MFKAINGWTKESIVDHIYLTFKGSSVSMQGGCAYRGLEGRKCAVGLFIPNDLYSPDMEMKSAKRVISSFKLKKHMPLPTCGMSDLQIIHDRDLLFTPKPPLIDQLVDWVLDNVS